MSLNKDPRRLFTPSQRRALYWAANGRCEECGAELDPKNWHADHDIPHSKGGSTDVINGRALCPSCNLKKGGNPMYPYALNHLNPWPDKIQLREWQKRFLERWLLLCDPNAGGQKDFLMAVVPAAGKTTASLKAAHEGMKRGWIGRIVVVVPSLNLVEQWINDANEKGLDLIKVEDYGTGISMPKDAAGIVTTYQTVARNPQRFRAYTSREPALVVGDEIHHCGDGENLSWGVGMLEAFDHENTIRLVSSGTPFRTEMFPSRLSNMLTSQ
jgi:superfamily II DNA or RNA helicase